MLMYCGQMVGWIKMPLGIEVGPGPGHIVLDMGPCSPKKGHSTPQFSAHVCCGQTAGWIKVPLRMEVGLGPGNIVLDGDPAPPPQKGVQQLLSPHFLPFSAHFALARSAISATAELLSFCHCWCASNGQFESSCHIAWQLVRRS